MSRMSITVYPPASTQPVLTESVPYTILPAPFASIVVFSAAQHHQAKQAVAALDQEIRNSGGKVNVHCHYLRARDESCKPNENCE